MRRLIWGPVYTACLLSAGERGGRDGSLCPDARVNVWRRCIQAGVVGGGIVCAKRPSAFLPCNVWPSRVLAPPSFLSLSLPLPERRWDIGERHGGLIDPPPNDPAICEAVGRVKEGGTVGSNEYLGD